MLLKNHNNNKMTVNEYRETACATAGSMDDADMEENVIPIPPHQESENENLLGRVLAGKLINGFFIKIFYIFTV